MSDTTISDIFTFDPKTKEFMLASKQDIQVIDANHEKYNWLQNLEAGRIVKISVKGKWTSSNDYDGLYESIAFESTSKKKKETSKAVEQTSASTYAFFLNEKEGYFLLRDIEGNDLKITADHKKYSWLAAQEVGRIIKINEKGRWNSSKDYKEVYESIGSIFFLDKKTLLKEAKREQSKKKNTDADQSVALKKMQKALEVHKKDNEKLQNPSSYPSSIDHRISRIYGLSDGLLQSNSTLTNIIFSCIQKYY